MFSADFRCFHLLEIELDQIRPLLGSTGGHWETIILVAAFLSHLEVGWRFQVSMRPIFPSRRGTI